MAEVWDMSNKQNEDENESGPEMKRYYRFISGPLSFLSSFSLLPMSRFFASSLLRCRPHFIHSFLVHQISSHPLFSSQFARPFSTNVFWLLFLDLLLSEGFLLHFSHCYLIHLTFSQSFSTQSYRQTRNCLHVLTCFPVH